MKYANKREITSQLEPVIPYSKSLVSFRWRIETIFRSLFTKRMDPTRLTRSEQFELGITERDIDWYNALHGPLIK